MIKVDKFGQPHQTANDLCQLLYRDPSANLHSVQIDDPEEFNRSVKALFYDCEPLEKYLSPKNVSIEEYDAYCQSNWYMPDEYKQFDIAKFVLDQCRNDEELQRAGKELLMFHERNLFPLLQFMKYFVDTMRKNKVVWGVGRGSSVASFVLFLIGVHRIDSLYYGLEIEEFLK